jgi:RNA polymerase sigma factor (sigma-70 family)
MATSQVSGLIQHLRRVTLLRDGAGLTDAQLLEDFISRRNEAALAVLVHRHAPMVWGVCRRVLTNYHDAEDAFQVTFLVLVRKAASIASRELVANWLYGVAHQTALKARATAARRKERERQVTEMPEPVVEEQELWRDLRPVLDEELSHLPDRYRSVIVLCDLAGKTRKDAARELGCPVGTVGGRLPPYNLRALNDDYQDARVRKETKEFVELEVISYPLNTNAKGITENRNWKKAYAGMKAYLAPGVTTNWDAAMQKGLLAELAKSGIDPDKLTDKQVVEQVSRWLLGRCKSRSMAFGTMYADFPGGKPAIFPGLEKAFARETGDPAWTVEEEFAHELLGKGMYYNRCRGSCTSSAVLMATVLRALGIPTRIVEAIPIVDVNDREQLAMVEKNIHHHQVRATITKGLLRIGPGFANHTYNEVFVGNRWRRLNYTRLGQNILDDQYLGLMIHVHVFNDLSEARFAPTWGRRYALGLRDEEFKYGNPYRTLEISDHFGRDSKLPNPAVEEHTALTVAKAYWLESDDTPDVIRKGARKPKEGEGHLYIHVDEWFKDQDKTQYLPFLKQVDRGFVLRAEGQPDIKGQVQLSFWTDAASGLREILLVIPKEEYAKMAKGVAYSIRPGNSVAGYQWKVEDGLTVSR